MRKRWQRCAVLCAAATMVACGDPVVPTTNIPVVPDTQPAPADSIGYVGLEAPTIRVGTRTALRAIVHRENGARLGAGIRVRWTLAPQFGVFDDSVSYTNADGAADMGWQPPTVAGPVTFGMQAGAFDTTRSVFVHPGPAARLTLAVDSLHFTRVGEQSQQFRLYDQYDNQIFPQFGAAVAASTTGPSSVRIHADSLHVFSGRRPGTGEVVLSRHDTGEELGRVKVISALVVDTIILTGAVAPPRLSEGESSRFNFAALDSGGSRLEMDAAELGISFASSDPTVASVSSDGVITGRSPGTATVTASTTDQSADLPVTVVSTYHLGSHTPLYQLVRSYENLAVGPVLVADGGSSIVVTRRNASHPYRPLDTRIQWYSPDGAALVERTYEYATGAALLPDGSVFVSNPLGRLSAQGQPVWTSDVRGQSIVADAGMVLVNLETGLAAFSTAGTPLWQQPTGAATAITPTRVYVADGSSLVALSREGSVLWSVPTPGPGVVDDQNRYFGAIQNTIKAIGADGSTLWSFTSAMYNPTFTLGPDESLIVATTDTIRWLDRTTGVEKLKIGNALGRPRLTVIGDRLFAEGDYLHVFDASTGAYLGRSSARVGGGPQRPVCTSLGLVVVSDTLVSRYASCR